jgi:CubicO group peptidase (beta-lactamase class C family)
MSKTVIVILFTLLTIVTKGQQLNYDSLTYSIEEKFDAFPNSFNLSIALIKNNQVHFIGLKIENDSIIRLDLKESFFEIGSITKIFTSTLLANEIIKNNLSLTDNINKVFSFKLNQKIKLSYLSLANHTSGLDRLPSNIMPLIFKEPENPYKNYTTNLFDFYLKNELHVDSKRINNYSYSNLGAGILAYALEKKANTSFESLLEKIIFEKYNMKATSFTLKTSIKGLNSNGTETSNWEFDALKGAGGLISNANDISKFVIAQFQTENQELALTRKVTHKVSEKMSIGLGWHIIENNTPNEIFWHNGATGGFTSSIGFSTNNNTGVIILSNISSMSTLAPLIDKTCFELLSLLDSNP